MSEKENKIVNFPNSVAQNIMERMSKDKSAEWVIGEPLYRNYSAEEEQLATKILPHFYTGNDFGTPDKIWKPCQLYDFNNPPIIDRDGFIFAMEPRLLSIFLQFVAGNKGDGNKMYHSSMMNLLYDVFCVKNPGESGPTYEVFFNSQLMGVTEEHQTGVEYSSYYPGLNINIKRPKACLVAFQNEKGEKLLEELEGDWCRYFLQGYELSRGHQYWKNSGSFTLKRARDERRKMFSTQIWTGKLV